MKGYLVFFISFLFLVSLASSAAGQISDDSQACIDCHLTTHPGIPKAWQASRMSKVTPSSANTLPESKRRVSFNTLPEALANVVVGCAECHTLNPESHEDSFDHNGFQVHIVVTPKDCATCHPVETAQFEKNLMSRAHGNLQNNPVYRGLADSVNGSHTLKDLEIHVARPSPETDADSCLYCHGTRIEVKGSETRITGDGDMAFPLLLGWPNQGVGRINPDGSRGSCTACHTRHRFSIEMARKPHTCSECHKGPDVPAYKVYDVSKHGNTYSALGKTWNYDAVPWVVGADFTAPTCAACHMSLLADEEGTVISERTHQMNDRLAWRIFGLIYAHPHPKSPDTSVIQNKTGLPLPTELTGEPVAKWLIDGETQKERRDRMHRVCMSCHGKGWVDGHFARFENTIRTSNDMTLTATRILMTAWDKGAAKGLAQKDSIFNETIERKWIEQWLFFGNSTRYASAMAGADYGAFANGRWYQTKNIQEMIDWLEFTLKEKD